MELLWSIICLTGLWGMVGCTVGLILNAFPARDVLQRGSSLRWGSALVVCFVLWMIGMSNA